MASNRSSFCSAKSGEWSDNRIIAAWLGHATVLINFFGIKIFTDPVLFPRIGIRLPGLTVGPKRLTASALTVRDLPKIDIVLLSHAHFDHFDMRTLHRFDRSTTVITAHRTTDLLRWTRFHDVSELRWQERKSVSTSAGKIDITAFRVKHWGARTPRDTYRGMNKDYLAPGFVKWLCEENAKFRAIPFPLMDEALALDRNRSQSEFGKEPERLSHSSQTGRAFGSLWQIVLQNCQVRLFDRLHLRIGRWYHKTFSHPHQ